MNNITQEFIVSEFKKFIKNKKLKDKPFRIILLSNNLSSWKNDKEKMFSPILKVIPLKNNFYLIEKFRPELPPNGNIDIIYVSTYEKLIFKYIKYGLIKNKKLKFKIDFPIRFYYKNKFVKILYPCVLFAGIINYFAKYIDVKIFDSNTIKEFIKESRLYVWPTYCEGKIIKLFNKEYLVGEYRFLIDINWKYYYLAKFIEFLAQEMITIPKSVKKRLREYVRRDKKN